MIDMSADALGVPRNSGSSWSFDASNGDTFRYEVQDGDTAAIDVGAYTPVERSDFRFSEIFSATEPLHLNFNLKLDAGSPNSGSFLALGQLVAVMSDGSASKLPSFEIDLIRDQMIVYVRYTKVDGTVASQPIYVGLADMVREKAYNIDVKAVLDPGGNGRLVLSIDGTMVADYQGPLGFTGQQGSQWNEGITRDAKATETFGAEFSHHVFEHGSQVELPDAVSYLPAPTLKFDQFNFATGSTDQLNGSVFGSALSLSTVNIYVDGVFVSSTVADAKGAYSAIIPIGSFGDHTVTAVVSNDSGHPGVASVPEAVTFGNGIVPDAVTTKNVIVAMGGETFWVQNAAKPWSISAPDANTVRFELRDNDVFLWDQRTGLYSERTELRAETDVWNGVPMEISYKFNMEQGARNDASWLVIGQLHQDENPNVKTGSPSFEVSMQGERMKISALVVDSAGVLQKKDFYMDTDDILRGHTYDFKILAKFDPLGDDGRLVVIRDGVTLVDYSGRLGDPNQNGVYWKEGIYRSASGSVSMAVNYSDLSIKTGDGVAFPNASDFISAPAITSATFTTALQSGDGSLRLMAAASDDVASLNLNVAGSAKPGTKAVFYENGKIIGEGTVDQDGHFIASLQGVGSGSHRLNVVAVDANGREGVAAAIEIDSAAGIMQRLTSLSQDNTIAAIVLSDTHVFQVGSTYSVKTLLNMGKGVFDKIAHDFSFQTTTYVQAAGYDRVVELYDSHGVITQRDRYSGSKLVYEQDIAADGSQIVRTKSQSGGTDIYHFAPNGQITEVQKYDSKGNLVGSDERYVDGTRLTQTFDPVTGKETGYTAYAADGSRKVATLEIVGQPYTQRILSYDQSNALVEVARINAKGVVIYHSVLNKDGSSTIETFDPTSGVKLDERAFAADGSSSLRTFLHPGTDAAATILFFDTAGKTVGKDLFDESGKLVASETWPAANAHLVYSVENGVRTGFTETFGDGSSLTAIFLRGSTTLLARQDSFDSAKHLVRTELFNDMGQKVSARAYQTDGGQDLTTFNPKTGAILKVVHLATDGSKIVDKFDAGVQTGRDYFSSDGHLTQTDLLSTSGRILSTNIFGSDGSNSVTKFDSATGLKLSVMSFLPGGKLSHLEQYSNGQLTRWDSYHSDGSYERHSFNGNGVETGYLIRHADGSREHADFSIVGKAYTSQVTKLDAQGNMTEVLRKHADGSLAFVSQAHTDGSSVITEYDAQGRQTNQLLKAADGSRDTLVFKYAGVGETPTSTIKIHSDTAGLKQWIDYDRPDGSHVQTALAAGGTLTSHEGVSDIFNAYVNGSDTFRFREGFGADIVRNFHAGNGSGHDVLVFDADQVPDYAHLLASLSQVGNDTLIVLGSDSLILKNIAPSALTEDNLRFVHHDVLQA